MNTVKYFLDNLPTFARGKKIRVLDSRTKKYIGTTAEYLFYPVTDYKITTKYIFIYVKTRGVQYEFKND